MLEKIKERYLEKIKDLLKLVGVEEEVIDWYYAEQLLYELEVMDDFPNLEVIFYCMADDRISDEDKAIILENEYSNAFCKKEQ